MKKLPDPDLKFPMPRNENMTYIKPTVQNPNIIAGEFSYYSGSGFESRVTHFYEFCGDKLIIGKFCQIAAGVEFVMNGANHRMNTVTTFPFNIFPDWEVPAPSMSEQPLKGDTVVGNDVWIGQNATILPGVHIGDGAIIGLNSTVASDVESYTIVAGNPARQIRRRFDEELTELLLELKWWDKPISEIKELMPLLTSSDLERVKRDIRGMING